MITDIFNNCLTVAPMLDNLAALSPSLVAVRFGSRKKQQMPIQARLIMDCVIKCSKFYGGRYLGSFGSRGSVATSTNPSNVHRPKFGSFKRCPLSPHNRVHTMKSHDSSVQDKSIQQTDTPTQAIDTPVFLGEQATHTETLFSKVPQTILNFSDEGLASLPNDYLAETVKDLGKYQDYCHKMAGLTEAAMVRIESTLNSRVGGV